MNYTITTDTSSNLLFSYINNNTIKYPAPNIAYMI